jgi:cell filamentation protein
VAIARSDMFCLPQHIDAYAAEVFKALAGERYLRRLPPVTSSSTGYLMSDVDVDANTAASMASLRGRQPPLRRLLDALVGR